MKNKTKILTNIILSLSMAISIISIPSKTVKADEIQFGVYPSTINNEQIFRGEEKEFILHVGNKSIFPTIQKPEKENLYTFDVDAVISDNFQVKGLSKEDKAKISIEGWSNLIPQHFKIKPGETQDVKLKINVPKTANIGEQVLYITFQRSPIKGIEDGKNTIISQIKVPIYIFINDKNNPEKPHYDADVSGVDIKLDDLGLSDESKNDNNKAIKQDMKKAILSIFTFNPEKIKDAFDDLKYRPYVDYEVDKIVLDIDKNSITSMKNVVSHDENKITDKQYVYIPSNINTKEKIEQIEYTTNSLKLSLANKSTLNIPLRENIVTDIREQMNNLMGTISEQPTLGWLLDTIQVSRNRKYGVSNLYVTTSIKNTGNVSIAPEGTLSILDSANKKVTKEDIIYQTTVIMPSENKNIFAVIPYSNIFKEGEYLLKGEIKIPNVKSVPLTKKFEIKNIRDKAITQTYIIIGVIGTVIITNLILGIRYGIKRYKKRKLLVK